MEMTVEFTDVYNGTEHPRVEIINVPAPAVDDDDLEDWAYEHLFPHTGDGKHSSGDAGYFVNIRSCSQRPDLVGREFEWGI